MDKQMGFTCRDRGEWERERERKRSRCSWSGSQTVWYFPSVREETPDTVVASTNEILPPADHPKLITLRSRGSGCEGEVKERKNFVPASQFWVTGFFGWLFISRNAMLWHAVFILDCEIHFPPRLTYSRYPRWRKEGKLGADTHIFSAW